MVNITFLLGAGASANALPLVGEIPSRLQIMCDYIQSHLSFLNNPEYIDDLKELYQELNAYNTIDNYARVLFQKRTSEHSLKLKKLKSLLCSLFLFEQLKKENEIVNKYSNVSLNDIEKIKRTVDPRYKSFFAKVFNDNKISDRINIISWNYDLQLEIAIENNLGHIYEDIPHVCTIYPHSRYIIDITNMQPYVFTSPPKIVKLNGTAGVFIDKKIFHTIYSSQHDSFEDIFSTLLDVHKEAIRYHSYNPFLKFAWEKDEKTELAISHAKSIMRITDILVVIGYSFPDFNRNIDTKIFQNNHIQEIFLQTPIDTFESVKYNMSASLGQSASKAKNISSLLEFFIPSQFIPEY